MYLQGRYAHYEIQKNAIIGTIEYTVKRTNARHKELHQQKRKAQDQTISLTEN